MNERQISWEEFFAMNLVGRDLEITSATTTVRARINEMAHGYYFVDPGGRSGARNFVRNEDTAWVSDNFISHTVRQMKWEENPLPKMKDDGTIIYTFCDKFITVHRAGDNLSFT